LIYPLLRRRHSVPKTQQAGRLSFLKSPSSSVCFRFFITTKLNPAHALTSVFLPASDIPSFVGKGNVDLGITGHDVILEAQMENLVTEELRLGFGKCSLQVQVPEASSIATVEDLAGKRIVTSFEILAGAFFEKLDSKLGLSGDKKTQIEYVGGSVEAACALGLADGISAFTVL
jgi:ATP phosphoribosyltransferase